MPSGPVDQGLDGVLGGVPVTVGLRLGAFGAGPHHHLGELVGLHPATLRRHFRARYGASPIGFRKRIRLNRAAWLLWSEPERAVADIAVDAGFVDESFFHRTFRAVVGITPAQYRARHVPTAD